MKELSEARDPFGFLEGFFSKQLRARALKVEFGSRCAGLRVLTAVCQLGGL